LNLLNNSLERKFVSVFCMRYEVVVGNTVEENLPFSNLAIGIHEEHAERKIAPINYSSFFMRDSHLC